MEKARVIVECAVETRVVPGSALALQSRDLCPRCLQVEAQRWSQGWKHRPPILLPPLRTHPALVLWLQVKTAGLRARRLRPEGCPLPAFQLLGALWGGLPDSLGYGDSAHLTPAAAAELWPWGAFVGMAPESHLMSGDFPGDLCAAVNCINLLSLGFCPSTCSRNLAEFFAFPCLSCFCRGKAELFDNNLLLDARLKL